MAMKQTQTKLFDFSDVGLDFSTVSTNLYLDRFKKMLALGYNEQTVSTVAVVGNQVTFIYGGAHGYAAGRVLKVNSGGLAAIYNGEFWIDSVTTNTVTMTIDDAPLSVTGGFTTKIAPLGWDLMYETGQVQIYKFKSLDETNLYVRMLFPSSSGYGFLYPCIGKSYDPSTGFIDDAYAYAGNKDILAVTNTTTNLKFIMHNYNGVASLANYTYAQGVAQGLGRAMVMGSKYHFGLLNNMGSSDGGAISAILPVNMLDYPQLDYPLVIGTSSGSTTTGATSARFFCGNNELTLLWSNSINTSRYTNTSASSYLPSSLDNFNTTAAFPLVLRDYATQQVLGMTAGGAYHCGYAAGSTPTRTANTSPSLTTDIDFSHDLIVHYIGNSSASMFLAFPLEEIKYGD